MNFINKLSIKLRITLGFTLISSLILVIGVIAYRGNISTSNSYKDYVDINNTSLNILAIDKDVSDLQRRVQDYIYTGYKAVSDRVNKDLITLEEKLKSDESSLHEDKVANDYFMRLQKHLQNYNQTFNFAVEERNKRKKLISDLKNKLKNLTASIKSQTSLNAIILESEKHLYEYLNDPDIIKINQSISLINNEIETLSDPALKEKLVDYKKNYFEIVQSTRGFLFLISVVMAAEAQEFSYVSSLLKDRVIAKIEPISNSFNKSNENTKQLIVYSSITLLIFAILLSMLISSSINTPISKLTHTFNMLAADKQVESIPCLMLSDEIGEMAKAAEIFRKKNEETKQLVVKLDENKQELEKKNDELDQFVFTVSHDLKSPIVTSMGFIGMMQSMAQDGEYEQAISKLPTLEKANKRMNALVNDLLKLSRIERADEDLEIIDIRMVAEDVFKNHQLEISKKGISTAIEGEFSKLLINETKITQVFDNLVSNAIKYCDHESNPKITIGAKSDDQTNFYFVKDNGSGIAKEYHDKVFTLFQRLRKDSNGTGIGLSIVQKVVTARGGKIWIESGEGIAGCTFWLEFPKEEKGA